MSRAVIVSTARTPIGKAYRGAFNDTSGPTLAAHALRHAARRAKAEEERALKRLRLLRAGRIDEVTQEYALVSQLDGWVIARNANPGVEVQGQFSGGAPSGELYVADPGNDRVLEFRNPRPDTTADRVFGHADFATGGVLVV